MKRILVIDDDEIVNDMIVQLLSEATYEAEGVCDGVQGLKLLKTKPFDLIITDIVMPEKEGIETIMEIRKINKMIPIIAISGGGKIRADEYLNMAKRLGADFVFTKPFETEQMLETIKKCFIGT